jgi:hypothetical protein
MTAEDLTMEMREIAVTEGYEEGSDAIERRIRQLKVSRCREIKGIGSCHDCLYFDYCDLVKIVMREKRETKDREMRYEQEDS